jgi:hypothetical protein
LIIITAFFSFRFSFSFFFSFFGFVVIVFPRSALE